MFDSEFERSLFDLRKSKLRKLRSWARRPIPTSSLHSHTVPPILPRGARAGANATAEELEANRVTVTVAGRIMAIRAQGKAGFATLQQGGERLQIYVRLDAVGEQGLRSTSCSIWATTSA
jgi:lysyl-tRNA synthetase class 2